MSTVIGYFQNDEFLLPYWLKHTKRLFGNGIMLNCGSTDGSVDIVKEVCPHWQLIQAKHHPSDEANFLKEIMQYERGIRGWKMVLDPSEFLILDNLENYLQLGHIKRYTAIKFQAMIMVESEDEKKYPLDKDSELIFQRTNGYPESSSGHLEDGVMRRCKIIHRSFSGGYRFGLYDTTIKSLFFEPNVYLSWFGCTSSEKELAKSYDLLSNEVYSHWINNIKSTHNLYL